MGIATQHIKKPNTSPPANKSFASKIIGKIVKNVPKRAGMNFVHLGLPEAYPGKQMRM